jgi:hypothetical protein
VEDVWTACGVGEPMPSCPTLYIWNGTDYEANRSIYPGAIPSENEYVDQIILGGMLVPKDRTYVLQIRELDPEVSFTDMVKLIIVDHSSESIESMPASRSCTSPEGYNDYLADRLEKRLELAPISAVHSVVGDVLRPILSSDDSYVRMHTGDIITLTFPYPPLTDSRRNVIFVGEGFYEQIRK